MTREGESESDSREIHTYRQNSLSWYRQFFLGISWKLDRLLVQKKLFKISEMISKTCLKIVEIGEKIAFFIISPNSRIIFICFNVCFI